MKQAIYILVFIVLLFVNPIYSQVNNTVYLLGNLKGPKLEKRLRHLSSSLDSINSGKPFTLLLLGDLRQKNTTNENLLIDFLKKVEEKNGNVIAVTGDRDWDKSSQYGLDTVANLGNRFKQKLGHNIIIPKHDCPGPQIIDLNENIRIIGLNSQWWLHPYRKVLPVDSECKNIMKHQILDELNEAIEEAEGKQVLLLMHHPIISGGVYGGTANLKEHLFPFKHDKPNNNTFLPIYGTFYHNYRRNIGSSQDMSSSVYKSFVHDIESVLAKHTNVIICSSHEYDMEILKTNNNFQIISGALLKTSKVKGTKNSLHATDELGIVKLNITRDSTTAQVLYYDKASNSFNQKVSFSLNDKTTLEPDKDLNNNNSKNKIGDQYYGGDYKAGFLKRLFFGSLYRDAWTTPLTIPTLNLDTTFGGLTPLKEGGGLQTVSLKFKDQYGRKYAFRSINKTPVKSIPVEFRIDLVKDITQDMTATQHPYGSLFVSSLLDGTNLYHEKAKLYIMPDSPKLGKYREKFAGMFGMLEPKPTELDDLKYSYQHANSVKGSLSVFKKLYNSPKHTIDTALFAKARIFDLFIGDWDRHEDNWKWLGFKTDSSVVYKIYPKDRDHAFSKMDGLFYYLADREWGVAFRENFDYKFSGLLSLTSKGNHMDRMLLSGLKKEDWLSISDELMQEITEESIDNAQSSFPEGIRNESGQVIVDKLKSRRKHLKKFVEDYYNYLSEEVDVIGTNKKEYFDVERLNNGNTRVKMISEKLNGKTLYDRTFNFSETNEIRLFGLGGRDSFYVHGESYRNILVRIMGGSGEDIVIDKSKVRIGSKRAKVYDYENGVVVDSDGETKTIVSNSTMVNEYDQTSFKSDTYLPIPLFITNPDDGVGGGFALNQEKHGFGHKRFESATSVKIFATSNGSNRFKISHKRNFERTDWYMTSSVDFGNSFQYYRFYGTGNNTVLNDSIDDLGLYKSRYNGAVVTLGSEYRFLERSKFSFEGVAELLEDDLEDASYFDVNPNSSHKALKAGGGAINLSIDFRDNPNFTNRGLKMDISNLTLIHNEFVFGKSSFELSYYGTSKIGIPLTLGFKLGTIRNFGSKVPFYHLANLGQSNNLRGYLRNRFSGMGANYLNTDLRMHFGKTKSDFLPLYYGIILFYDVGQITSTNEVINSGWHSGYGGGFYVTPLNKDFITLQINLERSVEQDALLKINLGILL